MVLFLISTVSVDAEEPGYTLNGEELDIFKGLKVERH
jgi:hypothetical protein